MCRHDGFHWGGSGGAGTLSHGSGALGSGGRGERLCCAVCFVLCIPLICIVVVPVPFVCCSVKLPLSRPSSFCLFLSILLRTPAGGRAAAWRFCCRPQPNHNTGTQEEFTTFSSEEAKQLVPNAVSLRQTTYASELSGVFTVVVFAQLHH